MAIFDMIDEQAIAPGRIATLDVIRGVAVMGILIMNIVAFAMPEAAYGNPAAYGGHTGADLAVWAANFVLIDGKMRGLFSFLFGASMLLVIDRAEARSDNAARVHFSRMAWLFLFGEAHLILLWWGDILNHYALVGCIAWFFRKLPPYKLVPIAILLIVVQVSLTAGLPFNVAATRAAMRAPHPSAATVTQYSDFQRDFGTPGPAQIGDDLALHRGPYAGLLADNLRGAAAATGNSFFFVGCETLGYMLLGMAGLRSGLLGGGWPRARYLRWARIGFAAGIPISAALALFIALNRFALLPVIIGGIVLPTLVRPIMIIGWACLILLLARPGGALTERIAAAGRMAFSNYLVTTMLCTTLFYGFGWGLYGRLSRAELYPVVIVIWALMLLWSKPWLARFRYGPFEWLWRSLARWRIQPLRGAAATDR